MQIKSVRDLMTALRQGKYTSVGSYPLFFYTHDGECLSVSAVRENIYRVARAVRDGSRDGWQVVAHDVNWESEDLQCADSGEPIECAYPST